jgi:hypothetical protein
MIAAFGYGQEFSKNYSEINTSKGFPGKQYNEKSPLEGSFRF